MKTYRLRFAVGLAILISLFLLAPSPIDLSQLGKLSFQAILLSCGLIVINLLISTFRWQLTLNALGSNLKFTNLLELYFTSSFLSNFLPSDFGGDAYKLIRLRGGSLSWKRLLASVFLDRYYGLVALVIMALASTWMLPGVDDSISWWLRLVSLTFFGGSLLLWWAATKFVVFSSLAKLKSIFTLPVHLHIKATVLSVIFVVVSSLIHYVIFSQLGATLDWWIYLQVVPLISLIGAIPLTPSSLGIKEGVGLLLFGYHGLDPATILLAMVIVRLLVMGTTGLVFAKHVLVAAGRYSRDLKLFQSKA